MEYPTTESPTQGTDADADGVGADGQRVPGVWIAQFAADWSRHQNGYVLVTVPGDINKPIALVDCWGQEPMVGTSAKLAVCTARHILADPDGMLDPFAFRDEDCAGVIDLRGCGSKRPMPAWIYGLRCQPATADGRCLDVPPASPFPFCKWFMRRMQKAAGGAA